MIHQLTMREYISIRAECMLLWAAMQPDLSCVLKSLVYANMIQQMKG